MPVFADNVESIGRTPLVRINQLIGPVQGQPAGKDRGTQSGVQREVPHRSGNDLGSGEGGPSQARTARRRAHQRQYGNRAGLRLRRQGLSAQSAHARIDVAGAAASAEVVRCEPDSDAGRRRDERRHQTSRGNGEGPQVFHAPTIQEPGEPGDPFPHDGSGDLGRHQRQRRRPRLGSGDRRNDHRRVALYQGDARPQAMVRRRRADRKPGPFRRRARARTRSRASAPASCPTRSTGRKSTKCSRFPTTRRSTRRGARPARRESSAASAAERRSTRPSRSPSVRSSAGKTIVVILPDSGRTLPVDQAVRRELTDGQADRGRPVTGSC